MAVSYLLLIFYFININNLHYEDSVAGVVVAVAGADAAAEADATADAVFVSAIAFELMLFIFSVCAAICL